MAAGPSSDKGFEEAKFMKELVNLKDTQDAVQCLSGWCIRNRKFSYKIARCWLKCAKKGKAYLYRDRCFDFKTGRKY
jgi:hypothetical protein